MSDRLEGKCAIITGGTSGLGREIVLAYLREGAKVVVQGRQDARIEDLRAEAAEEGFGEDVLAFVKGDVTNEDDDALLVNTCVEKFGTMNVLVHCAGIIDDFTPVADMPNDMWDKVIDVNLTGTMKVTRAALRYLVPAELEASLVLITSNAAFNPSTGGPAYSAAKAGANALMKAIAYEYYRVGIRCNSICPGGFLTNITDSAPEFNPKGKELHQKSGYNDCAWKWTGGVLGFPEQLAPLAVYLGSDESTYMNGNSCVIDAGTMLSH